MNLLHANRLLVRYDNSCVEKIFDPYSKFEIKTKFDIFCVNPQCLPPNLCLSHSVYLL